MRRLVWVAGLVRSHRKRRQGTVKLAVIALGVRGRRPGKLPKIAPQSAAKWDFVRSPPCNCNVYTRRNTCLPIDFRAGRGGAPSKWSSSFGTVSHRRQRTYMLELRNSSVGVPIGEIERKHRLIRDRS